MKKIWARVLIENIVYQIATETAWGRYEGADAIRALIGSFIINEDVEKQIAKQVIEIKKYM